MIKRREEQWRALGWRTDERLGLALDRAADRYPDAEAVVAESGRATFGELRARSDAVARVLLQGGMGPGDVVSWLLPNGIDAVAVAAAIWRVGATSNPLVPILRFKELSFVFAQLRPGAVIAAPVIRGHGMAAEVDDALTRAGHSPKLRLAAGEPHSGWGVLDPTASGPAVTPRPAAPDEPCLVLYTSGTTAEPKGVLHTSVTLAQEVRSMVREWGLSWRDTMLMASPLTHITGILQGLLVPCHAGARVVVLDRWDPEACWEAIERESVTYMAGATPFLQGLVEARADAGRGWTTLRQYCCGGAAVPPHLIEAAEELGISAYRAWGMTEFPTTTMGSERDPLAKRAHTDGRPAEGVEIEAVDGDRMPLPTGSEGELRVHGPERMVGYTDPALDEEVLDEAGWLYTGDVGIVGEDGYVRVTGRLKDIVNRGGEKFSTREIEDLVAGHPAVAEAAVIGLPDRRLGEQVCAVVVPRAGGAVSSDELAAFLHSHRLARQKVPERLEVVERLPRTPAGKVQKFELVRRFAEHG
jgi:acyl-CoA synthetase (AMP-forming)/AMP-acid ligase II